MLRPTPRLFFYQGPHGDTKLEINQLPWHTRVVLSQILMSLADTLWANMIVDAPIRTSATSSFDGHLDEADRASVWCLYVPVDPSLDRGGDRIVVLKAVAYSTPRSLPSPQVDEARRRWDDCCTRPRDII